MTSGYIVAVASPIIGKVIAMVCIAIFFGLLLLAYMYFLRAITHWKTLAEKFPAKDIHLLGQKYPKQDGYFGGVKGCLSKQFQIELAEEGLKITTWFNKGLALLIPWHDIRDVAVDASRAALLTVNYEKELTFSIPTELLTMIHQNVPDERFHKAPSFLELLKNRMAGRS